MNDQQHQANLLKLVTSVNSLLIDELTKRSATDDVSKTIERNDTSTKGDQSTINDSADRHSSIGTLSNTSNASSTELLINTRDRLVNLLSQIASSRMAGGQPVDGQFDDKLLKRGCKESIDYLLSLPEHVQHDNLAGEHSYFIVEMSTILRERIIEFLIRTLAYDSAIPTLMRDNPRFLAKQLTDLPITKISVQPDMMKSTDVQPATPTNVISSKSSGEVWFEFEIDDFKKFFSSSSTVQPFESAKFPFCDANWYVRVCPSFTLALGLKIKSLTIALICEASDDAVYNVYAVFHKTKKDRSMKKICSFKNLAYRNNTTSTFIWDTNRSDLALTGYLKGNRLIISLLLNASKAN